MKKTRRYRRRAKLLSGRIRSFIPILIVGAVFLFSGVKLATYLVQSAAVRERNDELQKIFESSGAGRRKTEEAPSLSTWPDELFTGNEPIITEEDTASYRSVGETVSEDMSILYKRNSDLIGWIRIPGVVSLPVVFRDNEYYIDHNFDGKKDSAGTIFLDESTMFTQEAPLLLLHGHNRYDGAMFGIVSHYIQKSFAAAHPYMKFTTLYETEYYVLAGAMKHETDASGGSEYYKCAMYAPVYGMDYNTFRSVWDKHAAYLTNAGFEESDALIMLSTCLDGNDRLLVLFRRVREGETMSELDRLLGTDH